MVDRPGPHHPVVEAGLQGRPQIIPGTQVPEDRQAIVGVHHVVLPQVEEEGGVAHLTIINHPHNKVVGTAALQEVAITAAVVAVIQAVLTEDRSIGDRQDPHKIRAADGVVDRVDPVLCRPHHVACRLQASGDRRAAVVSRVVEAVGAEDRVVEHLVVF